MFVNSTADSTSSYAKTISPTLPVVEGLLRKGDESDGQWHDEDPWKVVLDARLYFLYNMASL